MKKLLFGCVLIACCSVKPEIVETTRSIEDNSACVYMLEVYGKDSSLVSSGSCVAYKQTKIAEDKYVVYFLTAAHVVSVVETPASYVLAFNYINRFNSYSNQAEIKRITTKLEYSNLSFDFAIVSCSVVAPIKIVEVEDSKILPTSDIYTLGFPLSKGLHITNGIVSYTEDSSNHVSCSAPVCPGFSGGGVFDKRTGKLVGIIVSVATLRTYVAGGLVVDTNYFWDMSYFIPLSSVKGLL